MTESASSTDRRVVRTRRDVLAVATPLLLEEGWDAVTHAAVARRAGYSRATVYAHWPTTQDLVRDVVIGLCRDIREEHASRDPQADLEAAVARFADMLQAGRHDRLLAAVITRVGTEDGADALRDMLYESATCEIRAVLTGRAGPDEVDTLLTRLVGPVLVAVEFAGVAVTGEWIHDLVEATVGTAPTAGSEDRAHPDRVDADGLQSIGTPAREQPRR